MRERPATTSSCEAAVGSVEAILRISRNRPAPRSEMEGHDESRHRHHLIDRPRKLINTGTMGRSTSTASSRPCAKASAEQAAEAHAHLALHQSDHAGELALVEPEGAAEALAGVVEQGLADRDQPARGGGAVDLEHGAQLVDA